MLSAANPTELLRTTLSPSDITFRAITYLPDELLYDIPETEGSALSLFQGFKATLPEASTALRKGSKSHSHHRKSVAHESQSEASRLQRERDAFTRDLEVLTVRKASMTSGPSYCRVLHLQRSMRSMLKSGSSISYGKSF
jgi:mitochondrial division protein 1